MQKESTLQTLWQRVTGLPYKARDLYDRYQQILIEGHYRPDPQASWLRLFGFEKKSDALPTTTRLLAATALLRTGKSVGKRLMWLSVFALASTKLVAILAGTFAVAGVAFVGFEFWHANRERKEVIRERNFAGQIVEGARGDLCRLYQAQTAIMNVHEHFKQGSLESSSETILDIVKSVQNEMHNVKVIDPGKYGARTDAYDFSEPGIKLVFDNNNPVERIMTRSATDMPSFTDMGLKPEWEKAASPAENDILTRLKELEESLPPHMREELARRRHQGGSESKPASGG